MAGLVGIRAEDMEQVDALRRAKLEWPQGLPFIRPSVRAPVLVAADKGLDYKVARFGFSRRFMSFNARSENLTQSKLWKRFFGKHHAVACLSYVVEWIDEGGAKTPYLIGRKDRQLLWAPALVGPSLDSKEEFGFAICTRPPNTFFSHFHDRMVGVLTSDLAKVWISPEGHSEEDLLACVRAPDDDELAAFKVKGDIAKRKKGDWSAIETQGKPVTSGDLEKPVGGKPKQARLGE
ncbi:MAG TPA: SOS response-associated peptidase family protein [Candidatus Thermoplasmatota archaeon]|nr:SOS response-associated peptidase family protein [Candidatus Thermoplasmatota archaeon]